MFDRTESDAKFQHLFNERTAAHFSDNHEESFVFEVEAEREYVTRLKNQREKVSHLRPRSSNCIPSTTFSSGTSSPRKCSCGRRTVPLAPFRNHPLPRNQVQDPRRSLPGDHSLQAAEQGHPDGKRDLAEGDRGAGGVLLAPARTAAVEGTGDQSEVRGDGGVQRPDHGEAAVDDQEVPGEGGGVRGQVQGSAQQVRGVQAGGQEGEGAARRAGGQPQHHSAPAGGGTAAAEDGERMSEGEDRGIRSLHQRTHLRLRGKGGTCAEGEEVPAPHPQERNRRSPRKQLQLLAYLGAAERKWQKLKEECQLKELSISEMAVTLETHEKQTAEAVFLLRQQHNQEKSVLKEQLIQCENHIAKLERKIADCVRKEQCLYGKIKKYEVCLDAKRNLREVEKEELDRINMLLNLS